MTITCATVGDACRITAKSSLSELNYTVDPYDGTVTVRYYMHGGIWLAEDSNYGTRTVAYAERGLSGCSAYG